MNLAERCCRNRLVLVKMPPRPSSYPGRRWLIAVSHSIASTAVLINLNWSERIVTPMILVGLLASVLALSSVLLQLKTPESVQVSFDTPVIIDVKTHLPPQLSSSSSLGKRLGKYAFLAQPLEKGSMQVFSPPTSERDETHYYADAAVRDLQ